MVKIIRIKICMEICQLGKESHESRIDGIT